MNSLSLFTGFMNVVPFLSYLSGCSGALELGIPKKIFFISVPAFFLFAEIITHISTFAYKRMHNIQAPEPEVNQENCLTRNSRLTYDTIGMIHTLLILVDCGLVFWNLDSDILRFDKYKYVPVFLFFPAIIHLCTLSLFVFKEQDYCFPMIRNLLMRMMPCLNGRNTGPEPTRDSGIFLGPSHQQTDPYKRTQLSLDHSSGVYLGPSDIQTSRYRPYEIEFNDSDIFTGNSVQQKTVSSLVSDSSVKSLRSTSQKGAKSITVLPVDQESNSRNSSTQIEQNQQVHQDVSDKPTNCITILVSAQVEPTNAVVCMESNL